MIRTVTLLVALALSIATQAAFGTIIHIPADQPTIQAGIDASSTGDTVLVQPGIYVENINFKERNIVLGSPFLTTGDTSYISATVIDSDSSGSVVTFENGEDSSAVITGFTIRNGSSVTGGGIHCSSSSPLISFNIISGNCAVEAGGGIYCNNSNPVIRSNNISGNTTHGRGAGIYCIESAPMVCNNSITNNLAEGWGGGIHCFRNPSATIDSNTISHNVATIGGAAFCEHSDPIIRANRICENTAEYAGGIFCIESRPMILSNSINDNTASLYGGGVFCQDSDAKISNNAIVGNSSGLTGGGVFCSAPFSQLRPTIVGNIISDNSAGQYGGGIFCLASNATINNNTLSSNSASKAGGALYLVDSSPSLENCIIAFSTHGEAVYCEDVASAPTLTCCDVYGNAGGDWVGCIAGQAGINGNFSLDPLFCDTAGSDFHIYDISPCAPANNSCGVLIGALDVGCGGPKTIIDPDTIPVYYANAISPIIGTAHLGNFTDGHTVNDIDPSFLRINSTIIPASWSILPSYPGFIGKVMEMTFPIRDFILGYTPLWDTTIQTFIVFGRWSTAKCNFSVDGEVTMVGHTSGDINNDGSVNVADLTFMVNFLFRGGPEPPLLETADVDHNGAVDIVDLTELVRLLFR